MCLDIVGGGDPTLMNQITKDSQNKNCGTIIVNCPKDEGLRCDLPWTRLFIVLTALMYFMNTSAVQTVNDTPKSYVSAAGGGYSNDTPSRPLPPASRTPAKDDKNFTPIKPAPPASRKK